MDVISLGDFHLTNGGNTVFRFNIPPEKRILAGKGPGDTAPK